MNRIYTYIFLIFFGVGFSQNQKYKNAADEIISQIEQIEKGYGYNIKLPNSIACLTGIYPKKYDGTYVGIVYFPTSEELKIWKNFVNENHLKIKYKNISEANLDSDIFEQREILYEYEQGKFKSNFCK
ncbi:hypothetical protein [Flavobacterium difficile]|uniref:Uncharacterized protein n=1 Tax=Flavobacterium difficile TaxID=2709659 RepID=A0ABX0I6U7_9FLAO|nr:hypothetical protein [Flavobacterium difficile]NHM02842.1 hypothetical protein [Flavobacterium difficile]